MLFRTGFHYFLIGHRGVGKTTLLLQLKTCLKGFHFCDLDSEIEAHSKMSISQIFNDLGEEAFRELEIKTLSHVLGSHKSSIIALGAGFPIQQFEFPTNSLFIQLSRKTDKNGRILLDRPIWDKNIDPIQQYLDRYLKRQSIFDQFCDYFLELPEGFQFVDLGQVLTQNISFKNTILTLTPWYLAKDTRLNFALQSELFGLVEIRTDLIDYSFFLKIRQKLLGKRYFISIRLGGMFASWPSDFFENSDCLFECDQENLVNFKRRDYFIISSHTTTPPTASNNITCTYLKWSPELDSFESWQQAMSWQSEFPQNRFLAPRVKPCWQPDQASEWMRLLLNHKQPLHFIRADLNGSYINQPHWVRWLLNSHVTTDCFYAVIGYPVEHSYSPMFHYTWARLKGCGFFYIPVKEAESHKIVPTLSQHGLMGLAITSPLKRAFLNNQSINTLKIENGQVEFTNTDIIGLYCIYQLINQMGIHALSTLSLEKLTELIGVTLSTIKGVQSFHLSKAILIFGGGGLLESLKYLFPYADYLPARYKNEDLDPIKNKIYEIVIWSALPNATFPTDAIGFQSIWDLNYHENSFARTLSLLTATPYLSGISLFIAQGIAQQKFWG